MARTRAIAWHYWRLVRDTPRHVWRAGNVIGNLTFLGLIVLTAFLGYRGTLSPWIPIGLIALYVLVLLGVAEYDRFSDVERRLEGNRRLRSGLARSESALRYVSRGLKLQRKIERAKDVDELVLRAEVQEWERKVRLFVAGEFSSREAQAFDQPSILPPPEDWRAQLILLCQDLIGRLLELAKANTSRVAASVGTDEL
jgi:hypothetical protein